MSALVYTRLELVRAVRSTRFFLLSIGFPVTIYFVFAGASRGDTNFAGSGIPAPLYYMVGMASFGAIGAVLSSGARIAAERSTGWTRQLRLTPMPARSYLRSKLVASYLMALVTIALLCAAGTVLGVRLPAATWLHMIQLLLVGLVPFAALGIALGHVLSVDAVGPALGGLTALIAFISGTWFPLRGVLAEIGQWLPGYWLVQAARVAVGAGGWSTQGWLVVGAWSAALGALARYAYRRDTRRI